MKVLKKEIEMLCWFKESGIPIPLKFRVVDEEGRNQVFKIDHIQSKELEKLAGNKMYVYQCRIIINEVERIVVLKYSLEDCRWILYKM